MVSSMPSGSEGVDRNIERFEDVKVCLVSPAEGMANMTGTLGLYLGVPEEQISVCPELKFLDQVCADVVLIDAYGDEGDWESIIEGLKERGAKCFVFYSRYPRQTMMPLELFDGVVFRVQADVDMAQVRSVAMQKLGLTE